LAPLATIMLNEPTAANSAIFFVFVMVLPHREVSLASYWRMYLKDGWGLGLIAFR